MLSLTTLLLAGTLTRDAFGVPRIEAPTEAEMWRIAGRAIAEDRMWQMEQSRHLARGQLASLIGPKGLDSDREVLREAYSDDELKTQLRRLPQPIQTAFESYAEGVNDFLSQGKLPAEMASSKPRPWTTLDSAAIAVRLFRTFGRGGAGELRNLALLNFLKGRPNLKGRELDVIDDFAWFNDRTSPTTLPTKEDTWQYPPVLGTPRPATRAETLKQLAALPPVSLIELMPAIRLAERRASSLIAQQAGLPHTSGSYAILVDGKRSTTGYPILLSAPQMGFQVPSVVAEMSLKSGSFEVSGMCVPGVPAIAIGMNGQLAWGLTSGVADTDDIVVSPIGAVKDRLTWTCNVRDGFAVRVVQPRTADGPVVLQTKTHVFSRRMSYWGRELESFLATDGMMRASTAQEALKALKEAPMSFNAFFATKSGDIGYQYVGRVPVRQVGVDPRFPTLDTPWAGVLTASQLPGTLNPRRGWIANWNNKPAHEFPNGDTPVWGRFFRNQVLEAELRKPKLSVADVERAAWTIARKSDTFAALEPWIKKAGYGPMRGYDGWNLAGSRQASAYNQFFAALPAELLGPAVGNLAGADNLRQVAQVSLLVRALEGKTKFNFLGGRKAVDVIRKAMASVPENPAPLSPGGIRVPGEPLIPYGNRGTYIQVITFGPKGLDGRSVVPPGQSEAGAHATDQAPLSRAWIYKPMWRTGG